MKEITYQPDAIKALKRMPSNDSKRIRAKIRQYADDPTSLSQNVRALTGREGIRLKVGKYRVIMRDGQVLEVLKVGVRGTIYKT